VLRIFGPKRDEVTGGWKRLHNEELRGLYCLLSIIRIYQGNEDEVGGACGTNGGERNVYRLLVGKP
jgi:hypothetical protein